MNKLVVALMFLCSALVSRAQVAPITAVNKTTLSLMREQKKLARDVYSVFSLRWQPSLFRTLSEAEASHMEALVVLLDQYGVADPVAQTGDEQGRFFHARLQKLYDSLTLWGNASLEGALRASAFVEEKNIQDLQRAVSGTSSEDLKVVYKYLLVGAHRHLLVFARHLKKAGIIYHPVLLSQREYQRIVGASGGGRGETSRR